MRGNMILTPDFMRWSLLICIIAMALLSFFYLRRRQLPPHAYLGWVLLALFIPILGPFLVIVMRPGVHP